MFKKTIIKIAKQIFTGYRIKLQHANLVLITAQNGYVVCGYLNLKISNKLGEAACIVTGVNNPKDMLLKKVEKVSSTAKLSGVRKGMLVKDALIKLS